ncbi:MFS transporter [Orrella marina]|uniref:Major facilitator superfamily (MFS) profile domain-containing protein n=1 Tax=Orrella marina TaxID=2163011 RepID=A0A2R4XJ18_9BURK|nr:MFS transporter [Orrella marina]AWB33709.1 hypothetical protein DBV39_08350 [Orrella marina]
MTTDSQTSPIRARTPPFYGWRIVKGSIVIAFVAWAFALYGSSVYLSALSHERGWPIGQVSTALTLSFLLNALTIGLVGSFLGKHGPRLIMSIGAVILGTGLVLIGQITEIWQAFLVFPLMGLGWSCLSTIAITSTIAPWFERHQGKAISTALLGASLGGMFGVPITLFLVTQLGLTQAMWLIGALSVVIIVPIATGILRRRPQDLGLMPDGLPPDESRPADIYSTRNWQRTEALRTYGLLSVIIAFGIGLMVQVGFLSQQVKLLQSHISATGVSLTVLAAGSLAFLGRVILARHADRINIRQTSAMVLLMAGIGMLIIGITDSITVIILGVLVFGFNVGNLTTLPALIVRREFGSASFGRVFGVTGTCMQLFSAFGPALFGLLYDLTESYFTPLTIAALLLGTGAVLISYGEWGKPFMLDNQQ